MIIQDELGAELRDAMRSRDSARRNVIRQIETEVSVARAAPGFVGSVDDELYRRIIATYVKKMDKARKEYVAAGERGEAQAQKLAYEIDYLSRWMPETVDEEEDTQPRSICHRRGRRRRHEEHGPRHGSRDEIRRRGRRRVGQPYRQGGTLLGATLGFAVTSCQ